MMFEKLEKCLLKDVDYHFVYPSNECSRQPIDNRDIIRNNVKNKSLHVDEYGFKDYLCSTGHSGLILDKYMFLVALLLVHGKETMFQGTVFRLCIL